MSWFGDARRGRWDSLGIDSQLGSFTFSSRASVAALRARWGGGRIRERRDLLFFNVAWLAVEGSAMDARDAGFGSGAIRGACLPVRGVDSHGRGLFSAPAARRRGRCHLLSLYSSSILFVNFSPLPSVGGRPDTRVLPPSRAPAAFRELLRRVLGLLRSADPLAFDARHRVAPSETRPTAASMPRNILMTWKRNSARPTVARTDKGKVRSGAREPRPRSPVRSHASARAHVGCDAPHRGAHSLASLGETREDLVTLVHGEAIEDRSKK